MHAAIFSRTGPPDVIEFREVATPSPRPGEVLVAVKVAGLNHLDLWVRRGLPIETTMPHIGGSDFVGHVERLGDGVEGIEVGSRVVVNPALSCGRCHDCRRGEESLCRDFRILGEHTDGGFAEFALAPASNVYPIPDHVPFELAVCLPVSYQTAWRAVVSRARVQEEEAVLVLGASGGTAIAAIQIALIKGAHVYAVTSGSDNVEKIAGLGAVTVLDRDRVDFSRQVLDATNGRGVDVVIENVGAPTWDGSIRALAPGGRLVTYGATAGPSVDIDLRRLFWRQLSLIGTTMASRTEFEEMLGVAWAGRLDPVIDSVFPLSEAASAHRHLEEGRHFGKILIRP